MSGFNLHINEYTDNELMDLLNLSEPYSIEDIVNNENDLKEKLLMDSNISDIKKKAIGDFLSAAKLSLIERKKGDIGKAPIDKQVKSINNKERATIEKLLCLDTRFRDNYYNTLSTDYTQTLPTVIKNVISMELSAFEFPNTYYQISKSIGNNYFWIQWLCPVRAWVSSKQVPATTATPLWYYISIPDGNYLRAEVVKTINDQLKLATQPTEAMISLFTEFFTLSVTPLDSNGIPGMDTSGNFLPSLKLTDNEVRLNTVGFCAHPQLTIDNASGKTVFSFINGTFGILNSSNTITISKKDDDTNNPITISIPETDFGDQEKGAEVIQVGTGATGTLLERITDTTTSVVVKPTPASHSFDTTSTITVGVVNADSESPDEVKNGEGVKLTFSIGTNFGAQEVGVTVTQEVSGASGTLSVAILSPPSPSVTELTILVANNRIPFDTKNNVIVNGERDKKTTPKGVEGTSLTFPTTWTGFGIQPIGVAVTQMGTGASGTLYTSLPCSTNIIEVRNVSGTFAKVGVVNKTVDALLGAASKIDGEDLTEAIDDGTDVAVAASSISTSGTGTGTGTGTGLALKYTSACGKITSITVTNGGSGYKENDTITIVSAAMHGRVTDLIFKLRAEDIITDYKVTVGGYTTASKPYSVMNGTRQLYEEMRTYVNDYGPNNNFTPKFNMYFNKISASHGSTLIAAKQYNPPTKSSEAVLERLNMFNGNGTLKEPNDKLGGGIIENFGWIMGYRLGEYNNATAYISEGCYDAWGVKYLYLIVNDFNKNVNDICIPSYNESLGRTNVLARITASGMSSIDFDGGLSLSNNIDVGSAIIKRLYFGPVDIARLQLSVTDEFGRIINLNNMDYSMAIKLICAYD